MIKCYRLQAWGQVQGVGFRYHTQRIASKLNIVGFVANQNDGSVLIEAQGEKLEMDEFIEVVKQSPSPWGKVTKLTINEIDNKEYHQFSMF